MNRVSRALVGLVSTLLATALISMPAFAELGASQRCSLAKAKDVTRALACQAGEQNKALAGETPNFAKCNTKLTRSFARDEVI
jgi:hypothetical protein